MIERRDSKRNSWTQVETVRAKTLTLDITRLTEGVEYEFRVFAENDEGRSPALESKDKTVCRKAASTYFSFINLFLNVKLAFCNISVTFLR